MQHNNSIAMAKKVIAGFVSLILGRATPIIWGQDVAMLANGTITLPTPTTGDASQIAALTRMAVHEAGHTLHTDAGCFERLTKEQQWVFNLLEDPRMEKEQRKLFPGAGVILARGLDEALDTILKGIDLQREEDRAKVLQLDVIIRGMRALSPYAAVEQRAPAFEALAAQVLSEHQRKVIDAAIAELATHTTSLQTEDLAVRLERQLRELPPEEQMPPDAGGDQHQDQEQGPQDQGEAPESQEDQESGEQSQGPEPSSESQQGKGGQDESADNDNDVSGDDGQAPAGTPQAEGGTPDEHAGEGSEQPDAGECASGQEAASDSEISGEPSEDQGSAAPGQDATGASEQVGESEPAGGNPNGLAGEGGESCAQPGADQDAPQGQPQTAQQPQKQPTLPKSSYDLGDMLREAYEAQHGKIPAPQQQQDATQVDEQTMRLLAQAIDDADAEGADLEALMQVAIEQLEQAEVANQSGVANGSPGATALAAAVPLGAGPDLRLDGVQSRLVRVLLRELQDKRRRPTSYARAGGQVAVNRFWRLNKLGDTKVFRVKAKRNGVDAAVKVLLDRSGSMEDVLQTAAEATLAFSLAMQRVGNVSTSVAMFPALGAITESLQTFGQPAQQAVRRCADLVATGGTPLGAAVACELPDLLRQRKEKHVLVVITDDGPDDPELLAKALAEADENDVEVIGVGIGCSIRAFIPNSTSISCIEQLPDAMEALFREKLSLRLAA
jgi:cobalamin biosynthesis protein CobT